MKIDYDAIINAGTEYLAAKANLFKRYHAPIYVATIQNVTLKIDITKCALVNASCGQWPK